MPWHASATISGLKKEPSGHPGQVDYPSGQVSFHSIGKGPGKSLTGQAEFESYLQLKILTINELPHFDNLSQCVHL